MKIMTDSDRLWQAHVDNQVNLHKWLTYHLLKLSIFILPHLLVFLCRSRLNLLASIFIFILSLYLNHNIAWQVVILTGNFGHFLLDFFYEIWTKTPKDIFKNFQICQFTRTPGPFDYFSKKQRRHKLPLLGGFKGGLSQLIQSR